MNRHRSGLACLERRRESDSDCPCQPPGKIDSIVGALGVIGAPREDDPPAPPPVFERCCRAIKDLVLAIKPPSEIAVGASS